MTAPSFRPAVLAASIAFALIAPLAGAQGAASTPLGSGIERGNMDPHVRPQDDLFGAVNGDWVRRTVIPADKSRWGSFDELRDHSDEAIRSLVEALPDQHPAPGTNEQKISDFYRAFVDVAAIDQAGLAPLAPTFKEFDAVTDARTLQALMGRWQRRADMPVNVEVEGDPGNPDTYIANYSQGGLGLPDRDYYLGADERFAKARAAYVAYVAKLFKLAGDAEADAHASDVMTLETALAKAQWNRVDARDPKKTYNVTTPAQLATLAPGVEWPTFAAAASLPAGSAVVVRQPTYLTAVADLLKTQKLATWKLYMKARRLDAAADVLPADFRDASFEFHGKAIQGLQQERPRWQLAVAALDAALGEAGGELYVQKYFPPESKARAQALVANLMKAYASSIDGLTWMGPETKKAAHDKLSKYTVKIGYPDKWRDYSKLEIRAGDAFGNRERAVMFEQARRVVRTGQKVDRGEWGMTPQTVNAYYNQNRNEIVFPAAILQPPFFNVKADDAVNYGAIGAVIGHEISHGFDNRGSQYDGDGRLRNWWTEADRKAFDAITDKLAAQYDAYEPIPGKHVNGRLTMGENIADLSGLQIAFKAYKLSLNGKPAPVIDGLTGEQRFYDGFGQIWRVKTREERALQLLVTDPHSPGQFRAIGAPINSDGFHDAFGTKPGDGMWKAPGDRIHLW